MGDGFDALARVLEGRFGVVVLHAQSPRVDGYRACSLIKRHPACARTAVIVIVTGSAPYAVAEARVAGADRCLSSPLTETDLLAAVKQSLDDMTLLSDARREASRPLWMKEDVRDS